MSKNIGLEKLIKELLKDLDIKRSPTRKEEYTGELSNFMKTFLNSQDISMFKEEIKNTQKPISENKLPTEFKTGSSNGLTELIVGLMGGGSWWRGDDIWKGRTISMVDPVMKALVWKRDNQNLLLDVEVLRDNILFENIQKLAKDKDLPFEIVRSLNEYLQSLPGYVVGEETQEEKTLEHHGWLMMQFSRILSSLSGDDNELKNEEIKKNAETEKTEDIVLKEKILIKGENRIFGKESDDGLFIYIPLLGNSTVTLTVEENILKFLVETNEIKIKEIKGCQNVASFIDLVTFEVENISKYDFGKVENEKNEKGFNLFVPLKDNEILSKRIF